ncbi:MAG: glycosyl transferase family 2 [Bacteroidetes bacterium]|jgi:glycosyltransferase involved in cell wall biosynthesis|nr:glycosyl transferase family 2 [Bacteroidota bacterium]
MLDNIYKCKRNSGEFKFTILIPSWNNLPYLKLCVNSILQHSYFKHQLLVIVNEGNDGTLEWVKSQSGIDYIYSEQNIGICYALNCCRKLIDAEYVVYANDDMFFLPDWDKALSDEITKIGHKLFMLSATMIEPAGNNVATVAADYGTCIENFREQDLIAEYKSLCRNDWSGSCWPPNVMHIDCWDIIGGMSVEFSPGMYSDPDLARKLWEIGVRTFKGKGDSLVYHFGQRSTKRIRKNKGAKTFTLKWGISARTFMKSYLCIGSDAVNTLPDYTLASKSKANQLIKRIKSCF